MPIAPEAISWSPLVTRYSNDVSPRADASLAIVDAIVLPSAPTATSSVGQLAPASAPAEVVAPGVEAADAELEAAAGDGPADVVEELEPDVQAEITRTTAAATPNSMVDDFGQIGRIG